MNYQIVCGNLGADAELKTENGKEFVKFNVADSHKWTDGQGQEHEETTWVSCIINGRAEKIVPYLRKGQKVLVMGSSSVRVYSSKVQRCMVAGINLRVDRIELVGGIPEQVPSKLATPDGFIVPTFKCYFVDNNAMQTLNLQPNQQITLLDNTGRKYVVYENGYVTPALEEQNGNDNEDNK